MSRNLTPVSYLSRGKFCWGKLFGQYLTFSDRVVVWYFRCAFLGVLYWVIIQLFHCTPLVPWPFGPN